MNALHEYFEEHGITNVFMTTQIGRAFATSMLSGAARSGSAADAKNTHLKYLLKRSGSLDVPESENEKLYESVCEEFPELKRVGEKIKEYIAATLLVEPAKEEILYLMIHINRLCAREDGL